jgi:hypothetical protein
MTFDQLSLFDCEPQQPSDHNDSAHSGLVGVVKADGHTWFGRGKVVTSTGQTLYGKQKKNCFLKPKPVHSVCDHCGMEFHFNALGNSKGRYCGKTCAARANAGVAGKASALISTIDAMLNNPLDRCFSCGQWFRPEKDHKSNDRRITCSKECGIEFVRWGHWVCDQHKDGPKSIVRFNNCKSCGVLFTARSKATACCGDACAEAWRTKQAAKSKKEYRFKGLDDRGKNRKRHAKHGTEYDTSVTARKVAERDLMICQICGDTVERHLGKGWQPKGWSVGHIVPVSKGGTTTWDNVQCECIGCNVEKGVNIC